MILNARIDNNFSTADGITFTNGETILRTVGGGGYVDGYPIKRPEIVKDPLDNSRNVIKFTSTCPTDTYLTSLTRSQVDLVSPSWVRQLDEKWIFWEIFVPENLAKSGYSCALLSIYSNNSGGPPIRPGCFHAFIGDGTEGVPIGMVGIRSNTSDWYPRVVANVPVENFINKWAELVVNIDLEGSDKNGYINVWLNGELIYSAVRVNTVYSDTVDVHYKIGGIYFWATSPLSGEWYSYSAGMVIGDNTYRSFDQFATAAGARFIISHSGKNTSNHFATLSGNIN